MCIEYKLLYSYIFINNEINVGLETFIKAILDCFCSINITYYVRPTSLRRFYANSAGKPLREAIFKNNLFGKKRLTTLLSIMIIFQTISSLNHIRSMIYFYTFKKYILIIIITEELQFKLDI